MQVHDTPFQTGSAAPSPLRALSPSQSVQAFPDAMPPSAIDPAIRSSLRRAHPHSFSGRTDASVRDQSDQMANGRIYDAGQPNRDDASGSRASSALSRQRSTGLSSDAATTAMSRVPSTAGSSRSPSWANKGKGVALEGRIGQGDIDDDLAERQRRVERVLQRAEASKLARAFRNRLALASFKATRGWHDVRLDTIEPHIEQQALRRSQGLPAEPLPAPTFPTPERSAHPLPAGYGVYGQPLPHPHLYPQPQFDLRTPMYDMDDVLGSTSYAHQGPPPSKRARLDGHALESLPHTQHPDLYNVHSVYAPPPQPSQSFSPYSTASVYHARDAGLRYAPNTVDAGAMAGPAPSPFESVDELQPQLQDGLAYPSRRPQRAAAAASPLGSPRARRASSRRYSPRKSAQGAVQGQPLSSTDPHFSSFVDAATALTGMARAPSDPSTSQGSGTDEGPAASEAGPSRIAAGGGAAPRAGAFDTGTTARQAFARPATPERQILKLDGAPAAGLGGGGSGGGGNDSGTAEGAAELMLYLAASPSPVQSRKTVPTTLGDGQGVKGRRLFSGMGAGGGADTTPPPATTAMGHLDANGIFRGELTHGPAGVFGAASSALDVPFATSSSSSASSAHNHLPNTTSSSTVGTTTGLTSAPLEPVKSAGIFGGPATPGRQRQPSLGGGAASWELFINASPSPKRGGHGPGTGTGTGIGGDPTARPGGLGGTRGASPPHAAIGA